MNAPDCLLLRLAFVASLLGAGCSSTPDEFSRLQRRAAEGDARAQVEVGHLYAYPLSSRIPLPDDPVAEGVKYYRMAAEQGDAEGQWLMGRVYEGLYNVPCDYAEAVKWYRMAAEQGFVKAQCSLGRMYVNGWGVTLDYEEGLRRLDLAAAQGDEAATRIRASLLRRPYFRMRGLNPEDPQRLDEVHRYMEAVKKMREEEVE